MCHCVGGGIRVGREGVCGLDCGCHEAVRGADGERRIHHGQAGEGGQAGLQRGGLWSLRGGFGLLDAVVGALAGVATALVCPAVLLHVVLASEGLVAFGAEGVLLARVLLCVASSVARGGEVVAAVVLLCHGARVAVLLGALVGRLGPVEALGGGLGSEVAGLHVACGVRKGTRRLGEGWWICRA